MEDKRKTEEDARLSLNARFCPKRHIVKESYSGLYYCKECKRDYLEIQTGFIGLEPWD